MTPIQLANRVPLDDYAPVIGAGEIEEMRALAKPLAGRSVEMVNSTAVGGGVAANGPLRENVGVDDAATIAWTLTSPEVNRLLRDVRGWSAQRYQEWLSATLIRLLLP